MGMCPYFTELSFEVILDYEKFEKSHTELQQSDCLICCNSADIVKLNRCKEVIGTTQ